MNTEKAKFAIETISLTKIFPDWWGRSKVIAVDDLDLQIRHNEVYGLLGPNGSGKTTTIKILLSLLDPTKGAAMILDGTPRDKKVSERIGYLPEESYLYKYLTARETLDFYGRLFGLPRRVRKARIDDLLEMVGLGPMANRQVGTYSKGMARRIGLAQALINDPDVLILDEPTSGMDPLGTRQMKDIIIQLAKRGKTILLCSHLLADVEDVCDRIGILYGGRMQVEGPVGSLLKKTDQKQIRTSAISDEALGKIRSIVQAENADFDVTSPMDKLEEFFVKTVATAQKENQSTSGAISKGQISGFLAEEKEEEKKTVLEDLVETPVDNVEAVKSAESDSNIETIKESEPESASEDNNADNNMLNKLIQAPAPEETQKVEKPEQTEEIETPDTQVKKDVLDSLIGKGDDSVKLTEDTEKDSDNA